MEQLKTADGITLNVHKSILDPGTGSCPDVPWGSFSTSTVERFLEHCYRGDYSAPKPIKLPFATPTNSVDDRDEHADGVSHAAADYLPRCQLLDKRVVPEDTHYFNCSCLAIEDSGDKISLRGLNKYGQGKDDHTKDDGSKGDDTEGNDTEGEDDSDDSGSSGHPNGLDYFIVFLTHVELYILSKIQRRSSLTSLCLNRLREVLGKAAKAPVRPRFANNLSHLLFYAYNFYQCSGVRLVDDQAHELQNLVSSYAAMHIEEMKVECSSLMRHGGKMAEDLMNEVANRVINLGSVSKKEMEKKAIMKKAKKERKMQRKEVQRKELEKKEIEKRVMEKEEMERKKVAKANKKARKKARNEEKMEMEEMRKREGEERGEEREKMEMEMEMEEKEKEKEKVEKEKVEKEKVEKEKVEKEKVEKEKEKVEKEKEKMDIEKMEKMENEKMENEKEEMERKKVAKANKKARRKARKEAKKKEVEELEIKKKEVEELEIKKKYGEGE
ncbi:hypothetical protein HOY82DRAFT_592256 [Tuber indicum]|nr:hypothetical protein HOY82DRAFT_592256 [Tuber indicum]